jgi:hypothetical protein
MLRLVFAALFALLCWSPAQAQMAIPIASCGTLPTTLTPGVSHPLYMDINGTLCTAGGGGGSSGAVFGPTAVGSPAANPPLLLGGTATGAATGAVQVAKVDASGNQYVQCANCTGSGASGVDSSAFTATTSVFAPYGGVFNDGLGTLTSGQQAMQRMTPFRAAHSNLRNASGAEIGITAAPLRTDPTGTTTQPVSGTVTAAQATAANLNATVVGTGTFAVQASQATAASLNATVVPSALAAWGLTASTQNGATPTNAQLSMAQFNTTPTTITAGNVSPLQMDAAGNLLVNIKAGAGSGGTAAADNSVFTQGTTSETPMGCLYNTAYTVATSGRTTIPQCDSAGAQYVNVKNSNANGRATAANSSPVVTPAATGTWHLVAAASTNATSVKGSATVLFSCQLYGVGSAPAYLKIYNKATAPTVGTDIPVKTLSIPASATAANGSGSNIVFGSVGGLALATGFAAAVTTGLADTDTGAVAASTFVINCDYE